MEKLSKYLYNTNYQNDTLLYHPISNQIIKMNFEEYGKFLNLIKDIPLFKMKFPTFYSWLLQNLFIVPNDQLEINIIRTLNKKKIFSDKDYWLTINPTLECNLRCWYCSVKEATGKEFVGFMNNDILGSLKKHIEYMINEEKITGLHLDWFGGEPLLYFRQIIKPVVEYSLEIAKTNNIAITNHITTNGTLISKSTANQFAELGINSFQITIDGNKEKHDKIKFFKKGLTSAFDTTLKNILLLLKTNKNAEIIIRINFDSDTLDGIDQILDFFPIKYREQVYIDFHKIFQLDSIENLDINSYIESAKKKGYRSTYWAFRPQRFYTCYADKFYHSVINYDGKVYKCTAQDYSEKYQIGTLLENGTIEYCDYKYLEMHSVAAFENDKCLECKYLPLCFGPCIQHSFDHNHNCNKSNCPINEWELSVEDYIISIYNSKKEQKEE